MFFCLSLTFQVQGQNIWAEVYEYPFENTDEPLHLISVHFPTDEVGYCIGTKGFMNNITSFLLKTTDGGNSWSVVNESSNHPVYGFNIYFSDSQNGIIINYGGVNSTPKIYRTSDGGINWETEQITGVESIYDVMFRGNTIHLFAKIENNQSGFFTSTDSFTSWGLTVCPINVQFPQIYFISDDVGFGHSYLTVYKTLDGGESWFPLGNFNNPYSTMEVPFSLLFSDNGQIGFSVGTYNPQFLKTTDGGATWSPTSLDAMSSNIGILKKYNSAIYADARYFSLDFGENWTSIENGNNKQIQFLFDEYTGIATEQNKIYKMDTSSLSVGSALDKTVKIYPNPAHEKINLEYDNNLNIQKIQLLDLSGKVIKSYKKDYNSLDVSDIHNGEYILNIITNKGKTTKKILKL